MADDAVDATLQELWAELNAAEAAVAAFGPSSCALRRPRRAAGEGARDAGEERQADRRARQVNFGSSERKPI
eukprot:4393535-Prymnesium_polylepis.1